jgi:streptomycin 6-kinase
MSAWRVVPECITETDSSILVFGQRDSQPVVLKVIKRHGDEWRSGEILHAFEGRGVVRVYDYVDGAVLLERLQPGGSLASLSLTGADEEATSKLAQTIGAMSPRVPPTTVPTVAEWGHAFECYAQSGDLQIPKDLLDEAQRMHFALCETQRHVRLLHGDLHHYNVLHDAGRGWVAVDPKGVIGELEYEVGAALRNPYERPELVANPAVIRRRVERFASALRLDSTRVLSWAFAQAVLSALWAIEDGVAIEPGHRSLGLAKAIQQML